MIRYFHSLEYYTQYLWMYLLFYKRWFSIQNSIAYLTQGIVKLKEIFKDNTYTKTLFIVIRYILAELTAWALT